MVDVFKKKSWSEEGNNLSGERLQHLRFVDDIILISDSEEDLKNMIIEI